MKSKRLRSRLGFVAWLVPVLLLLGCGATPENVSGDGTGDVPCSCVVGAKRCAAGGIQVCEASSESCASWGPAVACPDGACANDACPGSCSDTCPGGTSRCASDSEIEVCRIGSSGCLQWSRQSCPAAQYCGGDFCKPALSCDSGCPGGYSCAPNGVCGGGKPDALVLNVQSVRISGKVTLNGAAPKMEDFCTANPNAITAHVRLTEVSRGYVFTFNTLCKDATFGLSGDIFPGTYRVSVDGNGTYSDVPTANYIANPSLVISADTSGLVFNVRTLRISGSVALNGAVPKLDAVCAGNPNYITAHVKLSDAANGYYFTYNTLCKDSSFAFSGTIYPGTYAVSIDGAGTYSDVPTPNYLAIPSLVIAADASGVLVNVKTVKVSGKVTLNGAAPTPESFCTANPTAITAHVRFSEPTRGYVFTFNTLCKDSGFGFTGDIYPGTYVVAVDGMGTYSNVPTANYVANSALAVTADLGGVVLDVRTVRIGGRVTLNGAAPTPEAFCAMNPNAVTSHVRLNDVARGYQFTFNTLCKDNTFSFSGDIYPGTYRVVVDGNGTYSDVPTANFVANPSLVVAANTSDLVFNVQTVAVSGKVTLNGAAPKLDATCAANPNYVTSHVKLTDAARGYQFTFNTLCKDSGFAFAGTIYPGTYAVSIDGAGTYSDVPTPNFVAIATLAISADKSGIVANVQTLSVSGKVTLNGKTPMLDPTCAMNPNYITAHVKFTEPTKGYAFTFNTLCKDPGFAFIGDIYPGTYLITVDGMGTYSDVPSASFVAVTRILLP